jgi:UDP-glucuronate 4-epimerase
MQVLVTGAAGFIGFFAAKKLLAQGISVVGIDNLNDYYLPQLKADRLAQLSSEPNFEFRELNIADRDGIESLFKDYQFDRVVHLAAQAGVRYSLTNPHAYADSNVVGTLNILEACRNADQMQHLVYASSSSVYGLNSKMPFSTADNVDHPVSLYAATKKSNELMAHCYSHLYKIPTTGLRFFTVYGPWGRPDMAYWTFSEKILRGEPLPIFNQGKLKRDFTYIDDIVEGVVRCLNVIPQTQPNHTPTSPADSSAPYRIYNIGNNQPVEIETFIQTLESALGKEAIREYLPMQPGDVEATWADIDDLNQSVGYQPSTPLAEGIGHFADWYLEYRQKL